MAAEKQKGAALLSSCRARGQPGEERRFPGPSSPARPVWVPPRPPHTRTLSDVPTLQTHVSHSPTRLTSDPCARPTGETWSPGFCPLFQLLRSDCAGLGRARLRGRAALRGETELEGARLLLQPHGALHGLGEEGGDPGATGPPEGAAVRPPDRANSDHWATVSHRECGVCYNVTFNALTQKLQCNIIALLAR